MSYSNHSSLISGSNLIVILLLIVNPKLSNFDTPTRQGRPKVARHCVVVVTNQELGNKWLIIATLRRQINLSGTVHILDVSQEDSVLIIIINDIFFLNRKELAQKYRT